MAGMWHIGLTVADLDEAIEFYVENFGFKVVHQQVQDNPYTRKLVGHEDASLKIAQLKAPASDSRPSSHHIELMEYLSPRVSDYEKKPRYLVGQPHIALQVDDIQKIYNGLLAQGYEFISRPNAITEGVNKGGWAVYFFGPSAIVHELVQPPSRKGWGAVGVEC